MRAKRGREDDIITTVFWQAGSQAPIPRQLRQRQKGVIVEGSSPKGVWAAVAGGCRLRPRLA